MDLQILCLIPARSGSKGIPHKNIKLFQGKPLLTWSIQQALRSKFKNKMKIIVSTDSEEYRKIALESGAEAPFLRPTEISLDHSTDVEMAQHAVNWLGIHENYHPDIILQLRPTYPMRKVSILDDCLDKFIEKIQTYDSLRTVVPLNKSPYKMYQIQNQVLVPYFESIKLESESYERKEPYNLGRQLLPDTFLHNGYIDIFKTQLVYQNLISGSKILPYVMPEEEVHDIDTLADWEKAEKLIN